MHNIYKKFAKTMKILAICQFDRDFMHKSWHPAQKHVTLQAKQHPNDDPYTLLYLRTRARVCISHLLVPIYGESIFSQSTTYNIT